MNGQSMADLLEGQQKHWSLDALDSVAVASRTLAGLESLHRLTKMPGGVLGLWPCVGDGRLLMIF